MEDLADDDLQPAPLKRTISRLPGKKKTEKQMESFRKKCAATRAENIASRRVKELFKIVTQVQSQPDPEQEEEEEEEEEADDEAPPPKPKSVPMKIAKPKKEIPRSLPPRFVKIALPKTTPKPVEENIRIFR